MDKTITWKYNKEWHASRNIKDGRIICRYNFVVYGSGKTKKEALETLKNSILDLNENVAKLISSTFKT